MTTSIRKLISILTFALLAFSSVQTAQARVPTTTIVLVVDDYAPMRNAVRSQLVQIGFKTENIIDATTGSVALDKLATKNFDLVIADWSMEPMTGLQLLETMRADPKLANIPFLMITAESKTENTVNGTNGSAVNYIVKPFNADTLKSKIMTLLGKF